MAERREVKVRSPQVWARARDAYVRGEPAKSVARRFDVGEANLRRRAREEGWTRKRTAEIQAETLMEDPEASARPEREPDRPVSPLTAIERALQRSAWLVLEGRAAEAEALMRAAERLCELTGVGEALEGRLRESAEKRAGR